MSTVALELSPLILLVKTFLFVLGILPIEMRFSGFYYIILACIKRHPFKRLDRRDTVNY